jgi:DNA topoisomerase I
VALDKQLTMRLRRSQLEEPGIRRIRCGRGFRYRDPAGNALDDATLERIRALAIPPAWREVWICPYPNGHIQAVGSDAAGRRQYRYHDAWRRQRDSEKFQRITEFGSCLGKLRSALERDLSLPGLPKERVLALGVRLLDVGMFRIGGEEYAETNDSYGIATLEKRHLRIRGGVASFDYSAKGGKRRQISVTDRLLVDILAQLKSRRGGGNGLLAWRDEHCWIDVSSHDLNSYLKERCGSDFTAKDFRTWNATLHAAVLCAEAAAVESLSASKRRDAAIVREVAELLGDTPAVCRNSYIDPRVFDCLHSGQTIAAAICRLPKPIDLTDAQALPQIERALIAMVSGMQDIVRAA